MNRTGHYTSGAFVITPDKPRKALLVHHRKLGVWLQPGGHQHPNENPYEAAIREVKEETGLDVSASLPAPQRMDDHVHQLPIPDYLLQELIPAHGDEPEHYHLDQLYVIYIPEQQAMHQALESLDIGWFTLDQLDSLTLYDNSRMILKQELSK